MTTSPTHSGGGIGRRSLATAAVALAIGGPTALGATSAGAQPLAFA